MITAKRLRELLHYDPETGVFTRLVALGPGVKIGDVAGADDGKGYRRIYVDGRPYRAHRLAWLYMTDEWPEGWIDHADMDRANNRWSNLREATATENKANMRARSDNTSGLKGVYWHRRDRKWLSAIKAGSNRRHLGSFDCPAAAHFSYIIAADEHFGEFARAS